MVEDLKDSSVGESVKSAGAAEGPAGPAPPVRYRRLVEVAKESLGSPLTRLLMARESWL